MQPLPFEDGVEVFTWYGPPPYYEHADAGDLLLSTGADIEADTVRIKMQACAPSAHVEPDTQATTPLFVAAHCGHSTVVAELLKRGANPNKGRDDGEPPLCAAAQNGHIDVVRLLLSAGADVCAARLLGATPLYLAAEQGHTEIVALLGNVCLGEASRLDRSDTASEGTLRADLAALRLGHGVTGASPLYIAVRNGHVGVVRVLLQLGVPAVGFHAEYKTKKDTSPSHLVDLLPLNVAVDHQHTEIAAVFLEQEQPADIQNKKGMTTLHRAIEKGLIDIVRMLLVRKCSLKLMDESGRTALGLALEKGRQDMVEVLLTFSKEADSCINVGRLPPLYLAVCHCGVAVVQMLLDRGGHVNCTGERGQSPLYVAVREGNLDMIRLLLAAGADVNATDDAGTPPLSAAVHNGHVVSVALLLAAGASAERIEHCSASPLWMAIRTGQAELLKMLLDGQNRDLSAFPSLISLPTLQGNLEIVQILLAHHCPADPVRANKASALYIACQEGHTDLVRCLLNAGATVDRPGRSGASPLYIAAQHGHTEIVCMLCQAGASVEAHANDGATPLFVAASNGHGETVRVLLAAGADVNRQRRDGAAALHGGAGHGHEEICQILLEAEANVNLRCKNGMTALIAATQNGQTSCVSRLLMAGGNPFLHMKKLDGQPGPAALAIARDKLHQQPEENRKPYRECVACLEMFEAPYR